jgi:peroxiredoxin/outer membrane lipoprotein-sorting protein
MKSALLFLLCLALALLGCQRREAQPVPATAASPTVAPSYSEDARALYDAMTSALRNADTLSYRSDYTWSARGETIGRTIFTFWLSKPNYARVEAVEPVSRKQGNIVIDGSCLWTWWPTGKPSFALNDTKTGTAYYMKEPAPLGAHSLGHSVCNLGTPNSMTILDPSTFHGYTDSLQPYVDGLIGLGTEEIGGETFDKIEVSIMDHQRSWYLWLSRRDHLPRKLHEVVRVEYEITTDEIWSDVKVNARIPLSKYQWAPPKGWTEYRMPSIEEGLLAVGTPAPYFEAASTSGKAIRLSSYKGKVVWLCFWRVGCPPCREEFPYLETVYQQYRRKGLIVLGYNCADERSIALTFMKEYNATFPNVLDTSSLAQSVFFDGYQKIGWSGVPLNYIIDREGKVAAAWYGFEDNDSPRRALIEKLLASKS